MIDSATALRIAHVQPLSLDLYGNRDEDIGTKVHYMVPNLAAAQARMGDRPRVHLIASGQPGRRLANGVEYVFHRCIQPPRSSGMRWRFARQLSLGMLRALQPGEVDVVHFHGAWSLHTMYAAVAWHARRRRLPLLAHDHGYRPVGRIGDAALRFALLRSSAIIVGNEESAATFEAAGVPPTALHWIPNGIDLDVYRPGPVRHRRPGDPLAVLVVSRLAEDKDPVTMATALALLAKRGRKVSITIVGEGPLKGEVTRRLDAAGVPTRLISYLPAPDLAEQYRNADVLVLTSPNEGSNQVTVEAMACGLPVVASDIPGIRENARGAGVLVPPGDAHAVAAALDRLADHPAEWLHWRERGLERARTLDWQDIARRVRELYIALLRDRPSLIRKPANPPS